MPINPRIRRTVASAAGLASAAAGLGLAEAAHAIPLPATVYGPVPGGAITVGSVPPSGPSSGFDYATINATGTAVGPGGAAITGYTYTCGAGGTLVGATGGPTGAACHWPISATPTSRPVTIRADDGNGLYSSKQLDFSDIAQASPNLVMTVTPQGGLNELTALVVTSASTTVPAGHVRNEIVNCGGDGVAGTPTASGTVCTYATPGVKPVSVTDTDATNNLATTRTANVTVIDKTVAALSVIQTGPYTVTANIAGSHVDAHLTGAYAIAWGDGTSTPVDPSVATVVQHSYATAGSQTAMLTVADSAGGAATKSVTLNVTSTAPQPTVNRYFGINRYLTGTSLSQLAWDPLSDASPTARHPQAVVLARGDGYADALAGVPLAAKKKGPLLLTPTASLDPAVQAEIQRILPTAGPDSTIYIVGGTSAVSPAVELQLTSLGYHVIRFGEHDRFATAMKIATDPSAMNGPAHVVVATGFNFPDALAAGPYAALPSVDAAIVLSQNTTFDAATGGFVASRLGAGGAVTAVGGQAAAAVASIPGSAGKYASFVGNDRYATAAKVAGYGSASPAFANTAPVGVATGTNFADALTGGAYMAQLGGPMLLTDPANLSAATGLELAALKPTVQTVDIFGGVNAVLPGTATAIVTAVNGIKTFAQ